MLTTAIDLGLVLLGFTLIIVVHELGHFLAAKWAGIRVLAFAVGFGPAVVSFRKGMGVRRGSSEAEFKRMVRAGQVPEVNGTISATEYRFNTLPLGGYVKMLGQDDADPAATSDAKDSYQHCVPWKRMVVISAGVVMNILLAAILFCVVFTMGLRTESPRLGAITPGGPAATARFAGQTNPSQLAGDGLRISDRVVSIDGDQISSFGDIVMKTVMARGERELEVVVDRAGFPEPLAYRVLPKEDPASRTLQIGVAPMVSDMISRPKSKARIQELEELLAVNGFSELQPGMTLEAVRTESSPGNESGEVDSALALVEALKATNGAPVYAVFSQEGGPNLTVRVGGVPDLETSRLSVQKGVESAVDHLMGIVPPLLVKNVAKGSNAEKAGLKAGDVFARLGSAEWPSVSVGIGLIQASAEKTIPIHVMRRESEQSEWKLVDLGAVPVTKEGRLGFGAGFAVDSPAWVGSWPEGSMVIKPGSDDTTTLRERLVPGTRITEVNGVKVASLREVREVLRKLPPTAGQSSAVAPQELRLMVTLPTSSSEARQPEQVVCTLTAEHLQAIQRLGWSPTLPLDFFEPESVLLREPNPINAIKRGVRETHSIMTQTYLTFVRLFQGTVKVEHLKGPVGIAHVGTLIAGKGWAWLLFFLALISVNLAVINFLPIPVTDGGHLLFLIYEQVTGRPPPVAFQNAAMLAGMVLIGAVFLFVLFNDIVNLAGL